MSTQTVKEEENRGTMVVGSIYPPVVVIVVVVVSCVRVGLEALAEEAAIRVLCCPDNRTAQTIDAAWATPAIDNDTDDRDLKEDEEEEEEEEESKTGDVNKRF